MFPLRRPTQLATRIGHGFSANPARKVPGLSRPLSCWFSRAFFSLLAVSACVSAQAQKYPAATIPEELKKDADAVVRSSDYDIEIKSPSHAIIRERHVYTILNSHADDLAEYRTYYDQLTSINSVEGTLYNAEGKEIKHFKKKEMTDRPVYEAGTIATDTRYKTGSFSSHQYPYTVEFEEEDELNGMGELSDWYPQTQRTSAVESSRCSITAPKGYLVRFKMMNDSLRPVTTEVKDKMVYRWEIRNIKPVPAEPMGISWYSLQPHLLIAPSEFEMSGYKGNMSTWNDYGKFYATLSKGRDVLPEDIRSRVHALIAGETDTKKKIGILYDFLQKNTHYISIQLGIGGLQPFDASYVSKNKYGDCKALSNYMVAILKEAGIPANAVIIRAGKDETDFQPDFPGHQFNHVIACVPMGKDTVWLECTDQYLPAGYLSDFTAGRYGLLITENGGQLVHTPDYALAENKQTRIISGVLNADGNLKMHSEGRYRAERQDNLEKLLHHYPRTEQESYLKQVFDLPTYDVTAFNYQQEDDHGLPVIRESLDIDVNSYAQVSGKRLFINPDLLSRSNVLFATGETRRRGMELREAYSIEDSVVILIPEGYTEESRPKDLFLKTPFGDYQTSVSLSSGKIVYHRVFRQFRGTFSAGSFQEATAFYNSIYKNDRGKIVLVKNQ